MLFDRQAALPVATIRSRSPFARLASRARGSRAAGWSWLRPRLVPVLVALTGMFAVLGSAEYLTRLARRTPADVEPSADPGRVAALHLDTDPQPGVLTIEPLQGAIITIDGNPVGRVLQLPSQPLQIHLVAADR